MSHKCFPPGGSLRLTITKSTFQVSPGLPQKAAIWGVIELLTLLFGHIGITLPVRPLIIPKNSPCGLTLSLLFCPDYLPTVPLDRFLQSKNPPLLTVNLFLSLQHMNKAKNLDSNCRMSLGAPDWSAPTCPESAWRAYLLASAVVLSSKLRGANGGRRVI